MLDNNMNAIFAFNSFNKKTFPAMKTFLVIALAVAMVAGLSSCVAVNGGRRHYHDHYPFG